MSPVIPSCINIACDILLNNLHIPARLLLNVVWLCTVWHSLVVLIIL